MRDPYAVLGLEPPVTTDQVRAAYRARSMLLHPDLHEGRPAGVRLEAQRAMAQLTEAYQTLTRADDGDQAPPPPSPLYRLGRLVGKAAPPGDGSMAFRLGRRVGRRRRG